MSQQPSRVARHSALKQSPRWHSWWHGSCAPLTRHKHTQRHMHMHTNRAHAQNAQDKWGRSGALLEDLGFQEQGVGS